LLPAVCGYLTHLVYGLYWLLFFRLLLLLLLIGQLYVGPLQFLHLLPQSFHLFLQRLYLLCVFFGLLIHNLRDNAFVLLQLLILLLQQRDKPVIVVRLLHEDLLLLLVVVL
jgi:hypothetical protein